MLTRDDFNAWFQRFKGRFPAVGEYAGRQIDPKELLNGWHNTLMGFTYATLDDVTEGIQSGELEPVDNRQLGQFALEIRKRALELNEKLRKPQEWKRVPLYGTILKQPKMAWMLRCAMAADKLLGVTTAAGVQKYSRPGSVRAEDGSYDAAIIMADDHTAAEERMCLETFGLVGLSWDQIQAEAQLGTRAVVECCKE